jgi:transposase, IS605 OrfB family, central region
MKVDLKGTWNKYYEKYKHKLGVSAQAVLQKNNEASSSFFSLLRLKKEGKLLHMNCISPPRYWKDRETKKRRLLLVVRQDRYTIDVQRHVIVLKDFHLEIEFTGRLRWYGKQGRLKIYYDETRNSWYASIPMEVSVETTKSGKTTKYMVKGERKSIQLKALKGDKVASVDLGINVLGRVVVDDCTWLLYKGIRAKEDYFYLQERIAEVQSLADSVKNLNELDALQQLNGEKMRLFNLLKRRLLQLYRNFASHLAKTLHELGVSKIYLGYPFNIAQDRGNKFTVNLWFYRKLMNIVEMKAQEYGIQVFEVVGYNTSRYCAVHNVQATRHPREVVNCPLKHKLHSDLNGALNILRKATNLLITKMRRPLSFLVFHNGVAPVKGCNP